MAELYKPEQPRSSPVTGPVAAFASLIIPGLGQMLALQLWRGLLVLGSMASILGLLAWRAVDLATRETGLLAILGKALTRRPFFIGGVLLGALILWLWNVWDAYQQAEPQRRGGVAIFALILLLFFALGWQISEINLYKAVTELSDVWPLLSKVLWPWDAAVTRDTETVSASAKIQIPCEDTAPESPAPTTGQPYIIAAPTCGELSYMDENNDLVMGTPLHLEGSGFAPNMKTQIYWKDSIGQEFHVRYRGEYVNVQTDSAGEFEVDLVMPYRLQPPSARGAQLHEVQARQISEVGGLKPSEPLLLSVERMIETIFLGMMATVFGIVFAIPVSFLAAKNLMSGSKLTLSVYYLTRTILNIIRSIEPLIWVIIAAQWVGLGPFAGIIALTVHSIAALSKLYSEAIEGINTGPIEAIEATGATRLQMIMYAVIPQMIPPFVSFSIYRWDINVRMSTIIGLVGGGGIGFLLIQYIRLLNFRAAGIAVWFIAITVALLDYISAEIRERYT
ncbi:MAG: phosphonate ABC transporter, permease protein PhnE [Anaerolineae bacterium]|nr:phosphonate ABC transporter, permease protein PhnE [Anaerolineae bacterium]